MNVEPVLITYNRASHVERTLSLFAESGYWRHRVFHVLDNASTDDTAAVVKHFQNGWPGLRYHRNRWNIGGNGNILRSVEIAESEYHWVIGDDDDWSFTAAEELERVLEEGQADIIRLGWMVEDASRGRCIAARELALGEKLFFSSTSMISSTILRRSLVVRWLADSYQNISNAYPHLVPVMRGTEAGDTSVYTLSADYMTHTPSTEAGYFFGDLEWYAAWFRTARHLRDPVLRNAFLREICHGMTRLRSGPFKEATWLAKVALNAKALGVSQTPYLCAMLGDGGGVRSHVLLAVAAYMALPSFVAQPLRRVYRRLAGLPPSKLRSDRSRI